MVSQPTSAQIDPVQALKMAKAAWDMFIDVGPEKPKLYLRLKDGHRTVRTKLFNWARYERMDPSQRVLGPYAVVFEMVDRMARDIDIHHCDMVYYDGQSPVTIDDDYSLLDAVEAGADWEDNKRIIDIVCDSYTEGTAIPGSIRYKKALKAYNYATQSNSDFDPTEKDVAARELKEVDLGGYSVDAKGVELLNVKSEKFLDNVLEIARKFKWGEETIAVLEAVVNGDRAQKAQSYVKFDAATWTFTGSYARFSAWKSDETEGREKYSIFGATAAFSFTVPRSQRNGDGIFGFIDTTLGGKGGTVQQKYIDAYKKVLESEAIIQSRSDIHKPDPEEFMLSDSNETQRRPRDRKSVV